MEEFQQSIQELITHCQKNDIDFNRLYKNAMKSQELHQEPKDIKEELKTLINSKKLRYLLLILATLFLIYLQADVITTHATAIGRILMIQALPFYDWRPLKRERCLIKMNSLTFGKQEHKPSKSSKDCYYCDGIITIPKLDYSDSGLQEEVKLYHDIDAPVIITNTSGVEYNMDRIQANLEYTQYIPCDLESNVYIRRSSTAEEVFWKLSKAPFYFAHWRNCDLKAMKQFRRFFPRPDYIPVNLSPIQQSWLILSKRYQSGNGIYKELNLQGRLGAIVVVRGGLKVRLTPMKFCFVERLCNDIVVHINEREALIISDQWEIDYLLDGKFNGVNMAVVLETR